MNFAIIKLFEKKKEIEFQQTANSKQQTANGKRQTANSKQQTAKKEEYLAKYLANIWQEIRFL